MDAQHGLVAASISALESFDFLQPTIAFPPLSNITRLDTNRVGGGELLKFKYAAYRADLTLVNERDLRDGQYLAQGQCSQVIAAKWRERDVAIKRIIQKRAIKQEILLKIRQLRKDIEVCMHPRLVSTGLFPSIVGHGMREGMPFIVMRLMNTGNLTRMLYTPQPWDRRILVLQDVARGLKYLHENEIFHGDIKADNILVSKDPDQDIYHAQIADFSHAIYEGVGTSSSPYLGTYPYIPPEVWLNESQILSDRSDVWTFGVLFWKVCHYDNDNIVDQLKFVPSDEGLSSDTGSLRAHWVRTMARLKETLQTSPTVPSNCQLAVNDIFASCICSLGARASIASVLSDIERITDTEGTKRGVHPIDDSVLTIQNQSLPSRSTLPTHFSIFKVLQDRVSWPVQVEFYISIDNLLRDTENCPTDAHELGLVPFCQGFGFGCAKSVRPLYALMSNHIEEQARLEQQLQMPELSALRLLNRLVLRLWGRVHEVADESQAAIEKLRSFLSTFPTEAIPYNMVWSAVRHNFPVAACFLALNTDVSLNRIEPIWNTTPLHMLWNIDSAYVGIVCSLLVKLGVDAQLVSLGLDDKVFTCPRNGIRLYGSPLRWAVRAQCLPAVLALLDVGADPLQQSDDQTSALQDAIAMYSSEIAKALLSKLPALVGAVEDSLLGRTILLGFSPRQDYELERITLHGEDIGKASALTLDVVLSYLPQTRRTQFLDMVLHLNVSSDFLGYSTLFTPYLVECILQRRSEQSPNMDSKIAAVILERLVMLFERDGANIVQFFTTIIINYLHVLDFNARTEEEQRTVLHFAAIYNATPLVPFLIQNGAHIESRDRGGLTPLGLAAHMAAKECFEELLHQGAGLFVVGGTALHCAAAPMTSRSLLPFILHESNCKERFRDVHIVEGRWQGITPLAFSVQMAQVEAVEALLQVGANPRAPVTISGWHTTISVRELALIVFYRPGMMEATRTMQRQEDISIEQQILNVKTIKQIFYHGCKDSNYEEEDSIWIGQKLPGDTSRLRIVIHARRRRQDEEDVHEMLSLDVLKSRPPRGGISKWDGYMDLRDDERVLRLLL